MAFPSPIPFDPSLETISDDERQVVSDLNQSFREITETTAEDCEFALRSVHAKSHGILEGSLTIDEGLPPELSQGLFSKSGTYPLILRMSTNAGDMLDDSIALPRGLAMKVMDVEGQRLPDSEGTTQDFIMINAPAFAAPDAESFSKNLSLLAKTTDRVEWLKKIAAGMFKVVNAALDKVGVGQIDALALMGGMPNVEPMGETYNSAVPFRYGDYVAKFSLRPIAPWMRDLTGETIDASDRPNAVREDVRAEMFRGDAEWEFCVQLLRDVDKQPIEDASAEWPEDVSPFQRVGVVRAASQDSWLDSRVETVNMHRRFSPWTGLEAHRPLGNVNRARKQTYRASADLRSSLNNCPYHEPGA
ncbi:catalase family protein [Paracoccus sp. TK19116]|uniref:Catalase family protein n=1 Tax=Paracoccus albicereus TaxID=2922394 RepID=A0ABT1MN05_9RHOB|nr:catalase family protein [Paracoccus albicereus]MCQ0969652.1 catalase family protein [Paracoccus albicereus]